VGERDGEHRLLRHWLHRGRRIGGQAGLRVRLERGGRQDQGAALHLHVELSERIRMDEK